MGAVLGGLTLIIIGLVFLVVPPAEGLGYYVRLAFFHIPVAWVAVLAFFMSAFEGGKFLRGGKLRRGGADRRRQHENQWIMLKHGFSYVCG